MPTTFLDQLCCFMDCGFPIRCRCVFHSKVRDLSSCLTGQLTPNSPRTRRICLSFYLEIWLRHISRQLIIRHDLCWKAASSLIHTSKRSLAVRSHHQHTDILSNCQKAAKVPNNFVAKLSICGCLGVALAADGLSVRAWIQKAPRFICCRFFLETCGFVTSATIHWAVLLYCLILSRVEKDYFWQ